MRRVHARTDAVFHFVSGNTPVVVECSAAVHPQGNRSFPLNDVSSENKTAADEHDDDRVVLDSTFACSNTDDSPVEQTSQSADGNRMPLVFRLLIYGLLIIGVQIGVGIVAAVGCLIYFISNGSIDSLDNVNELEQLLQNDLVLVTALTALPLALLTMGVSYFCRRYLDRRNWKTMGFVGCQWTGVAGIPMGMFLGILPILLAAAFVWLAGGFTFERIDVSFLTIVMVPTLVLMAFTEEIMFRGYMLQNFVDDNRSSAGILLSSVVFWLVHGLNPGAWDSPIIAVNLFGAGIILAQAYLLSGNIWFPTVLHFGWNFAQGVMLSIPVSGLRFPGVVRLSPVADASHWLTGGNFGLEGSALVTLFEIAMIVFFFYSIKSTDTDANAGSYSEQSSCPKSLTSKGCHVPEQ